MKGAVGIIHWHRCMTLKRFFLLTLKSVGIRSWLEEKSYRKTKAIGDVQSTVLWEERKPVDAVFVESLFIL
jgi:hypothetical protein